jgi:hypothetical protein
MAELFAVANLNISVLISHIFKANELNDSVVKYYFTTATDGKKFKDELSIGLVA